MTMRALLVAVEDYPESTVTSASLPGTIENADKFAGWLAGTLRLARERILFCTSGESAYKTHGARREDVKRAVLDLLRDGVDDTDRLFVYLTGHGLSKPRPDFEEDRDVLLCSEFVDEQVSGDACLPIGELTKLLADGLGPGAHMWFVDMCRSSNATIVPAGLGIAHRRSEIGAADWFQLLSTETGQSAATNSDFVDALVLSLDGEGDSELAKDESEDGSYLVTFSTVAKAVTAKLAEKGRRATPRLNGVDDRICAVRRAGVVKTITGPGRSKVPPVRLLCLHDEVIFLGETSGQLPRILREAFDERRQRPWKRIDVLSLDDLVEAHRVGTPPADLEAERAAAEEFFRTEGPALCAAFAVYRTPYVGTYGSLWTAPDGARRVHASARLRGHDIRTSPASDYVDFPHMRDPIVEAYFDLARKAIAGASLRFSHP